MKKRNPEMRKLKEPVKVAFDTLSEEAMDRDDAETNRSEEFWSVLERSFNVLLKKTKNPKYVDTRRTIKTDILEYLGTSAKRLSEGTEKGVRLRGMLEADMWECVKFIVAFNTKFDYVDEDDKIETDYLDEEGAFRYDVIMACHNYILEGASLAKRIGSPAYDTWVEALVKLNDEYSGSENYKAVDLIESAYVRTWGDLCIFRHMNTPCKSKKDASKPKKRKK